MPQVELLGALIGEEFERFATLSKIHGQKGVSAAIRTVGTTASAATTRRIQLLTTDLMAAEMRDLRAETSNPSAARISASLPPASRRCSISAYSAS